MPDGDLDPGQRAIAAIRAYCGWHVAPVVESDIILDVPDGSILQLPTRKLLEAPTVWVGGSRREVREWSPSGLVDVGPFRSGVGSVRVVMRHGHAWEDIPDVVGVFEQLRKRVAMSPVRARTQDAGPYRVSLALLDGMPIGGNTALMLSEREALDRYRLTWGW